MAVDGTTGTPVGMQLATTGTETVCGAEAQPKESEMNMQDAKDAQDAARYRWLVRQTEFSPETRAWEEFVERDSKGRKVVEEKQQTFWLFSLRDDWRLCVTQDERPNLDSIIDSLMAEEAPAESPPQPRPRDKP